MASATPDIVRNTNLLTYVPKEPSSLIPGYAIKPHHFSLSHREHLTRTTCAADGRSIIPYSAETVFDDCMLCRRQPPSEHRPRTSVVSLITFARVKVGGEN